jgi:hypothetical protein
MEIEMAKIGFSRSFRRKSAAVLVLAVLFALFAQSSQFAGASSGAKANIDVLPGVAGAHAAVQQGESLETFPPSLVPILKDEIYSRFIDPCESEPDQKKLASPAAVACTFGDSKAAQVMALYGDSYAEQLIPAFDALGKADHFKVLVYVRYGCDFADVIDRDYLGTVDPGCATFRKNVISAINSMTPAPSLTLLAEAQFPDEYAANGSLMSFKAWAEGIRSTLTQFHVRPLGVVMGTPVASNTPDECLSEHSAHIAVCATSLNDAFSKSRDKDNAAAVMASGAEVVNLSSLLCGKDCPEVIDNQLVFADKSHLDKLFVQTLTTAIGSLVGCIGTEVPPSQDPPGGILQSLLGSDASPAFGAACKATNSAPYNL